MLLCCVERGTRLTPIEVELDEATQELVEKLQGAFSCKIRPSIKDWKALRIAVDLSVTAPNVSLLLPSRDCFVAAHSSSGIVSNNTSCF